MTWSLIPKLILQPRDCEKLKTRIVGVSEKRLLRIYGPKREEVAVPWLKLHNRELNGLKSRRID